MKIELKCMDYIELDTILRILQRNGIKVFEDTNMFVHAHTNAYDEQVMMYGIKFNINGDNK